MTYRMDSAKPPPRVTTWGYEIDYDEAIARDLKDIEFLSSDFAKALAAYVEKECLEGRTGMDFSVVAPWLAYLPELAKAAGFSEDDVRALAVAWDDETIRDSLSDDEYRRLWRRGNELAKLPAPDGYGTWEDFRSLRETGKKGRAERLKKAKASLSRHRRNKAKYGR